MKQMDISAILPIYNCRERLERHLHSVKEWVHSVEELIVVDSGSTDGSLELARDVLEPFGAKFIHHPPGLYQSWNAGVAAGTRKWLYFSTVEDPITCDGLRHLYEAIARHDADMVISPPEMRNHDGTEPLKVDMPSNRLADAFFAAGHHERLLGRAETIALLCGLLPHGLLGSSASNLYRTDFLQKHPFPTDFGHCGDTAWGVSVSPFVKTLFTTKSCARFLVQTTHVKTDPETQRKRHEQLSSLAKTSLQAHSAGSPEIAAMLGWFAFSDHSTSTLWDWIAGLDGYNQDLKRETVLLAERTDALYQAQATIGHLEQRLLVLKQVKAELAGYYGFSGAWKCLRKSFPHRKAGEQIKKES